MRKVLAMAFMAVATLGVAQDVRVQTDGRGRVTSMQLSPDTTQMNWILSTDGSQYSWVTDRYSWGNGRVKVNGRECWWQLEYGKALCDGLQITVERGVADGGDYVETYTFSNVDNHNLSLSEIGIFTPWNDNYPDANICVTRRCNAHIWAGGNAAYVCALRMGGQGPHMGLLLTEGSITDYEVFERGQDKGMSNFRGVIALCPTDSTLMPGQSMRLSWRIFAHNGKDDFERQMLRRGGLVVSADKYVAECGQDVTITLASLGKEESRTVRLNALGDCRHVLEYGDGKTTFVETYATLPIDSLLARRVKFIMEHQQMLDTTDVRYGAYMVYDNEGDSILTHYTRSDLDEGRERVGMGVLLADYCMRHPCDRLMESLTTYATFLRTKLQDESYRTKSSLVKSSKNRGYNYAWVADFYFKMYQLTGNVDYARHGYGTIMALYRHFGNGFYCIRYPVVNGLKALADAGMMAERDTLLSKFQSTGDTFVANGLSLPKFEVNYEQSIVAPAVQFLCELYLVTGQSKYLDGANVLLPALDAFSYRQPSCYMNDIGLRHWDGHWFGKRPTYGDTYPHYWSAITAGAFHYYALATGQKDYQRRAEGIVRGNLVSFAPDGRATCAILRPVRVNGQKTYGRDAYANDQDWALVFYLMVCQ